MAQERYLQGLKQFAIPWIYTQVLLVIGSLMPIFTTEIQRDWLTPQLPAEAEPQVLPVTPLFKWGRAVFYSRLWSAATETQVTEHGARAEDMWDFSEAELCWLFLRA